MFEELRSVQVVSVFNLFVVIFCLFFYYLESDA